MLLKESLKNADPAIPADAGIQKIQKPGSRLVPGRRINQTFLNKHPKKQRKSHSKRNWKRIMCTWNKKNQFVEIRSKWMTLIGEHFTDDLGQDIEYWRVEKPDSIIVIPAHNESFVAPKQYYRPGVNINTYDFPGGRLDAGTTIADASKAILMRELNIKDSNISVVHQLNTNGYLVDSSFSNQRLFGVAAILKSPAAQQSNITLVNNTAYMSTLTKITCLQCRQVFTDYLRWKKSI